MIVNTHITMQLLQENYHLVPLARRIRREGCRRCPFSDLFFYCPENCFVIGIGFLYICKRIYRCREGGLSNPY